MFSVIGILCTGMSDLCMEGVSRMSHGLINVEFARLLSILDEVLQDQMHLMDADEKTLCVGACESDPRTMYFVDGCDIAVEECKESWMWKTHKDNVKKNRAARFQILVDTLWGYFRGMEAGMAGVTCDQGMLTESVWNESNVLTSEGENVGADGGYYSTQYINISKPFTVPELAAEPYLKAFNEVFNAERSAIERAFAFLKYKCQIFARPWKRQKWLLPIAVRVCLKLCNQYWRSEQHLPMGLQKIQNMLDEQTNLLSL